MPISRPAVTAVGIYNAVILWNFQGEFSADVPAMMAALLLSMIPLLVFYAITKERLIEGLVSGALKG